jgi:hypothetical protein
MRNALILLAVVFLAGCSSFENKLVYIEGVTKPDEKGARVEVQGGGLIGSPSAVIENVKTYVTVPMGWKGPLPWETVPTPPTPVPE